MRHAFTVIGLVVGFALLAPPTGAQTSGGARGRVIDEEKEPIADVTVIIEFRGGMSRRFEVTTSRKGAYMQVGLPAGPYHFAASKEGYVPAALDIRVGMGGVTQIPDLELVSNEAAAARMAPDTAALREQFAKGVELAQAGQLDEAETVFLELLEIQPGLAEAYRGLGYVHAQRQDWTTAEENYQTAIDLRPGDPTLTAALAQMYQDSGQEDKAVALMSQAASENPEDARTQLNKGIFLLSSGDSENAAQAFEAALVADPSTAEAHYHLGTILVGQGKVPEAIEHLEAYVATNPDNDQNAATAQGLLEALKQ